MVNNITSKAAIDALADGDFIGVDDTSASAVTKKATPSQIADYVVIKKNLDTDDTAQFLALQLGTSDAMTINGATVTAHFQLNKDVQAVEEIHTHSNTAGDGAVRYFARSRGTTASPTVVQNGDTLATIAAVGYDGTDYALGARIDFVVDGTPGNNDMPTKILFKTSPDGSHTPVTAVTIDNTGLVTLAQLLTSVSGGTGNGFTKFSGPTTSEKTFTLPNASATLKYAGKETIWIPAAAMRPSASGGCASAATIATSANQPDIQSLDFDTTTQEYAQFSVAFPKSWNEGTVTAQFFWSHASTTTNFGVVWNLQGVAMSDDDAIAAAYGTAQQVSDTGGTTNDQYVTSETSAITIAGTPAEGDLVNFRVSRVTGDGSDTMAIDARLMGIKLYFTTDAGSDE